MSISSISAENLKGINLGSVSVLKGTSAAAAGVGDPVLYPLLWWGSGRGQTYPINTNLYRILVLKMTMPGNWNLNLGSVARVIWKVVGEGDSENVSEDVIIRHKSGSKYVMNSIIADLNDLPLEAGAGSPSHTGWSGMVEGFRIDPHEFSAATNFFVEEIKIAAFERANEDYTIRWDSADTDALPRGETDRNSVSAATTVSFYRDTNNSGFNGTLIASGVSASAGQYTWDTSALANGTYYIYGIISDGTSTNRYYARWPIVVDHNVSTTPTISLSTNSLSFTGSGSKTFNISNSGGGTLNWSVTDNASWLSVSPSSGNGC
jgi:BACON domain-containing protein/Ser-Thr-rich glycosyl-phosphatidyl-inositol-anchored membrane family protein